MSSVESIVNIKNVRKPGHKKRVLNLIITISIFVVILLSAYLFLIPKNKKFILTDYKSEKVQLGDIDRRININGKIKILDSDVIISTEDGICVSVLKKVGDIISKDDTILIIESEKLNQESSEIENELKLVNRNRLKGEQDYKRSIRDANRAIEKSKKSMEKVNKKLLNAKELYKLNSITKIQLEDAEENYLNFEEDYRLSQQTLNDLIEDQELDLQLVNFDIDNAKNKLTKINKRLDRLNVKSDIDGTILEIKVKKGNAISSGYTLLQVGDLSTPYIEGYIPVKYSEEVTVGSEVIITYEKKKYNGLISLINSVASEGSNGEKLLYCEISLNNELKNYIAGSTVGCEIILSSEKRVLTIKRGEYLLSGKNRYVYKIDGDKALKTEVKYGTINSSLVAISNGLESGDKIITSSYNDFIEKEIIYLK